MPFFEDKGGVGTAVLYIHIPKTGGTSVEQYLSKRFRTPLGENSFYTGRRRGGSLQHQTLSRMETVPRIERAMREAKNAICFATVRCPYDRAVSDLLWHKRINPKSSKRQVEVALEKYIHEPPEAMDYHNVPQVTFVQSSALRADIVKVEELGDGMRRLGFSDFPLRGPRRNMTLGRETYADFLSPRARSTIESFYQEDFTRFSYQTLGHL